MRVGVILLTLLVVVLTAEANPGWGWEEPQRPAITWRPPPPTRGWRPPPQRGGGGTGWGQEWDGGQEDDHPIIRFYCEVLGRIVRSERECPRGRRPHSRSYYDHNHGGYQKGGYSRGGRRGKGHTHLHRDQDTVDDYNNYGW